MEKKKIKIRTYEMGESIFAAIIFLIFGIFLVTNPGKILKTVVIILGIVISLVGAFKLLVYYKMKDGEKKEVLSGGAFIVLGMASIICALIWFEQIQTVLRIILAIYLIYVGIYRFVYAFKAKGDKKPYFINAGIILLIGVLLITIPGLIFKAPLVTMGILIILYSIAEIFGFVVGRKNGNGVTVAEAVVISEKDEDVKLLK